MSSNATAPILSDDDAHRLVKLGYLLADRCYLELEQADRALRETQPDIREIGRLVSRALWLAGTVCEQLGPAFA